jgi:hypothetical protein
MRPFEGFSDNLHLPYFAMGVHPDGFTGSYGRKRALDLLIGLYKKHNDCTCTRRAALPYSSGDRGFSAFGRVRFIKTNPGHGENADVIDTDLDEDIFVRRERQHTRLLMRFYDRETELPFLAEASVVEGDGPSYVAGVREDGWFHSHVLDVRKQQLVSMKRYRALLSKYGISLPQLRLLQAPDSAEPSTEDVEALVSRGYFVRSPVKSESEKTPFLKRVERQLEEVSRLEAKSALADAERIRQRADRVLRRIHATRLERTAAGYKVAKSFPETGVIWY